MSGLTLYTYWRSSAAYRVRIALNLKRLDYQSQTIDLLNDGGKLQSEAYLHLNPQGLVPTLVDGTTTLTQSLAIIEYLDEQYPDIPLLPSSAEHRAYVKSLALIIACEVHPLNNLQVLHYLNTKFQISAAAKNRWYQHWVEQGLAAFEQKLRPELIGRYCLGDSPGLADLFLVPQIYNANRFGCNLKPFSHLLRINKNCLQLKAFKKSLPENQEDAVKPGFDH